MAPRYIFSSLTRISDLAERELSVVPLPQKEWATGQYVVVEVRSRTNPYGLELPSGRLMMLAEGDMVVGALGERHATLEVTGTWRGVGPDGRMEILGGGGILGRCTSRSVLLDNLSRVGYQGHVTRDGRISRMSDFAVAPGSGAAFRTPVILIIGTSMSAGKTTAARVIVRMLKARGLAVLGAKITGAGRYRDVLSMSDAGADWIMDFVDAGLPSTVVPTDVYAAALANLLGAMADLPADVAVIEAGASPLEPYNGSTAVEAIRSAVKGVVLCASDPYAVLGVMTAFDAHPDVVTGPASNTRGGIDLVRKLTGIEAINVLDRSDLPRLEAVLVDKLGLAE